ncbi:hypothetical protein HanHA300_Chr01g0030001 [Helianthus annuus]|nr:hypothetical protein HanHA300_Chr01g0030001 [Helianthus annuus]KAJ0628030.1 hypothetical protein HanHA89_Chr01g0032311 [Helianthus annuus]KAJ0784326.1 hypothetical protein HanLR1_Chr01g0030861 [Helianthus annuus]
MKKKCVVLVTKNPNGLINVHIRPSPTLSQFCYMKITRANNLIRTSEPKFVNYNNKKS